MTNSNFNLLIAIFAFVALTSCKKNNLQEENLQAHAYIIDDGRNKDEFGCVTRTGEPPMTKCVESTGKTCKKLHNCESVLSMRASGDYTDEELAQSESLGMASQTD